MSAANNLTPININPFKPVFDPVRYFNNLSLPPLNASPDIADAVQAFFESVTGQAQSAKILASAVIYTCATQGMPVMQALQEFQKVPPGGINQYLAMFLNLNRVGTSLLGLNNHPKVNQFVQRSILL